MLSFINTLSKFKTDYLDSKAEEWLRFNREERMDANDNSGIFLKDRQQLHRRRYEFAVNFVKDKRIADIACGTGYGTAILGANGAVYVMGMDVSLDTIQYATLKHTLPNTEYLVADATALPVLDGSIEVVVSFETIEHVKNTSILLSEFSRILCSNGLLIVSTPNDWGFTKHHFHTWTPFEFVCELYGHFSILSIWEQHCHKLITSDYSCLNQGIYPSSKETENRAETIIIVAQKRDLPLWI